MSKFVKYLGKAHVNFLNLALYSSGAVRLEHVTNGKCLAARQFVDPDAAEAWFDSLPGNNLARTQSAISALKARE